MLYAPDCAMSAYQINFHLVLADGTVIQQTQVYHADSGEPEDLHVHIQKLDGDDPENRIYKVNLSEETALLAVPETKPLTRRRDAILASRARHEGDENVRD